MSLLRVRPRRGSGGCGQIRTPSIRMTGARELDRVAFYGTIYREGSHKTGSTGRESLATRKSLTLTRNSWLKDVTMAEIEVGNRDYWIKVVGMLQQNWALIADRGGKIVVYFLDDNGKIFDQLQFLSAEEAKEGLKRNGFSLFSENKQAQQFIALPRDTFSFGNHPNGKIYSSGRYWK